MNYNPNLYPKCAVSPAEVKRVKGLGWLWDKRTPNCFNGRVITRNGKITAEQMNVIADAAKQFGSGEVAFTTRLTAEIQCVPFEKIAPAMAFLGENGLMTGGTGPKVRPVVSCKGTTCQYGLIDTYGLSAKVHERFFVGYGDVKLPHKFKIAVGGCPNNCVKPDLNDVGVVGQRVPQPLSEKCKGCRACEKECPIKSAKVVDKKFVPDTETCNHCGRCVKRCPFGAIDCTDGYKIYIGGRWGKKAAEGRALSKIFTSEEETLLTIEKAILFFRDQGVSGERFADTVKRVGFENAEAAILSDELLERKQEILAKTL